MFKHALSVLFVAWKWHNRLMLSTMIAHVPRQLIGSQGPHHQTGMWRMSAGGTANTDKQAPLTRWGWVGDVGRGVREGLRRDFSHTGYWPKGQWTLTIRHSYYHVYGNQARHNHLHTLAPPISSFMATITPAHTGSSSVMILVMRLAHSLPFCMFTTTPFEWN